VQLDLRCRQLKLIEVRALAEALRFDDSVTALCLASTGLSAEGCVAVARVLGYDGDGTPSVFGAEETAEWLEEFNLEAAYNTNIRSAPAHLSMQHARRNMQHATMHHGD
jgi:hypothetical protein